MSAIVSTVANIRTISLVIGLIAVIGIIWYISESLKNPLKGLFGAIEGNSEGTAKDEIRDEIDQCEQSIKKEAVTLKNQTNSQIDKARDLILDKEQDTAEQVKRVVERENEEGEERLLDELESIEARILANLDDESTPEGNTKKWNRLLTSYNVYVNHGSNVNAGKDGRALESFEYAELIEALQSGMISIGKNGGLMRNF